MKRNKILMSCLALAAVCFSANALAILVVPLPNGGQIYLERLGIFPTNVGFGVFAPTQVVAIRGTLFEPGQPGKRVIKDLDIYVGAKHVVNVHH